ncbi:integral membrane protein [Histoplasma capsulatum]|uniref:Integral membrane protein n=1 Tax=Ajellomyces capsulatus TaxID=5037 RepID=A0A8A1M1S9_AJECA|nr:integral membrane protein [Histoplasma capsulatum]
MDDPGPPPDGDVNKGPMLNAITWTECGVALALVLARIITRTRLIQRWGWDDAFMCLAMLCALVNTVCVTICIHYGTGRHVYYLNDYQKVQANKYNWVSQGFHVMSTNWGKVSVAFFLLRIVDRAKRQRYIFFVGMVVLTIVNSVCVYTIYGQCTPTTALWNGVGPGKKGSCWHPNIQRDYAFFQGSELVARSDYTFETINLTTWISTEQYLIIIAACIPTLGPLFTATTGRTPSGRRAGSTPGYKPSGSHSRRYFQQGHSSAGASGFGYKKRAGSDMLTYTMDEFTTTTNTNDGWTRTSPPNGRKSDEGSEDAIIKGMPETDVVDVHQRDRAGSNERTQSSRGILKTMEVQVNSQNLGRNMPRRPPANKKVLLPWEPTSPA